MKRVRKKKLNQRGQGLIEFLITMSIILTLLFVFVELSWALAWGHYVHYATFMSARSYMAGASQKQDQLASASSVLQSMVLTKTGQDLLGFIAKSRRGDNRDIASGAEDVPGAFIGTHPTAAGKENTRAYSWAEGVQYNFEVPLYVLPLARWINKDKGRQIQIGSGTESFNKEWKGTIPFTSDSWLGREATNSECLETMKQLSFSNGIGRQDGAEFIEDNGC